MTRGQVRDAIHDYGDERMLPYQPLPVHPAMLCFDFFVELISFTLQRTCKKAMHRGLSTAVNADMDMFGRLITLQKKQNNTIPDERVDADRVPTVIPIFIY